jgi:diguanylate cyclase (GGDEF)-like protein
VAPIRITGLDGIERAYVSVALPRAPAGSAFVRVGIPTDTITAEANQALQRNLLVLAAVALLVFAAAWIASGVLVVTPTRRLIAAVEALGRGDTSVRTALHYRRDELGQLAAHFDAMAARLERVAFTDTLTGLPNRTQIELRCAEAIAALPPATDRRVAVFVLHLERFLGIQNAVGFEESDRLIVTIAERLALLACDTCVVGRLMTDRFAVLVPQTSAEGALELAQRFAQAFVRPFAVAHVYADVGVNIGAALYPEHGADPPSLIRRADIAAMQAHTDGTGLQLYRGLTEAESPERLQLMVDLRRALEEPDARELSVHYQAKVSVRTGEVVGAESLIRWQHPVRGNVPPGAFIAIAEETGLIRPLTYWVIGAVLRQQRQWVDEGLHIPLAVNLSVRNLHDPELLPRVAALLAESGVAPPLLQFEVTESMLMEDTRTAQRVLAQLREAGMHVSIDDFGTGYSSLRYLASLPLDALKIDRGFIVDMVERREMRSLVAALIRVSRELDLKVIAEGVETEQQVDVLRELGCDEIQGYFYCKPQNAEAFVGWCRAFRRT